MPIKYILVIFSIIIFLILLILYLANCRVRNKKPMNARRTNKIADTISEKFKRIDRKKQLEERKKPPDYEKIEYYITYMAQLEALYNNILKNHNNEYHNVQ